MSGTAMASGTSSLRDVRVRVYSPARPALRCRSNNVPAALFRLSRKTLASHPGQSTMLLRVRGTDVRVWDYAEFSTDVRGMVVPGGHTAEVADTTDRRFAGSKSRLCCYAFPTRRPVLAQAMLLRVCYMVSGTVLDSATRCPVLTSAMLLPGDANCVWGHENERFRLQREQEQRGHGGDPKSYSVASPLLF
eukprot:2075794-Rhodomonas_salina.3